MQNSSLAPYRNACGLYSGKRCVCKCSYKFSLPSTPLLPTLHPEGMLPARDSLSPSLLHCQTQRHETGTEADSASLLTRAHTRLPLLPNLAPSEFHLGLSHITSTPLLARSPSCHLLSLSFSSPFLVLLSPFILSWPTYVTCSINFQTRVDNLLFF